VESTVYFCDLRTEFTRNMLNKLGELVAVAGLPDVVGQRDLVAIKLHFGEAGNTGFIRPVYLRKLVEATRAVGGNPFLTDANTLYVGSRTEAVRHLTTAVQNGFAYSVVNAPIIIADGLKGTSEVAVAVGQRHFETAYIAAEIANADALLVVSHFKGHEISGFGGALKNIGMGCASRRGKLAQHSGIAPKVKAKRCIGCGTCVDQCPTRAISLKEKKACVDPEPCCGCGGCILACPAEAIQVRWNPSVAEFQEKVVEYGLGVMQAKKDKVLFVNFITDVTPACDCVPYSDAPIVADIGIVASTDPVAIDQAAVDLVNAQTGLSQSFLKTNLSPGQDKFRGVYPDVDWEIQLNYAQKLGLGTRNYTLKKI
jgi:uncharacterized protein